MATKGLLTGRKFDDLARGSNMHARMLGAARLVLVRGTTYTDAGRTVGTSRQAVQQACERLLRNAAECPLCHREYNEEATA